MKDVKSPFQIYKVNLLIIIGNLKSSTVKFFVTRNEVLDFIRRKTRFYICNVSNYYATRRNISEESIRSNSNLINLYFLNLGCALSNTLRQYIQAYSNFQANRTLYRLIGNYPVDISALPLQLSPESCVLFLARYLYLPYYHKEQI